MYYEFIDDRHIPLVSLAAIDIGTSLILCGWEKWDNFEGIIASAIFTFTLVAVSYISKAKFIPYGRCGKPYSWRLFSNPLDHWL